MRVRALAVSLLTFVLSSQEAAAQSKACPQGKADAAEAAADQILDWHQVAIYMKRFHACDEGLMQEGSSASVAHLLADHWQTLPQLVQEIHAQPRLRDFVLAHINTTSSTDDINRIEHQANTACPTTDGMLCKQIAGAAHEALHWP